MTSETSGDLRTLGILVSGLGNRGINSWLPAVEAVPGWELAGVHDVAPEAVDRCVTECGVPPELCALDLEEALQRYQPDALLLVSPMQCHAEGIRTGLERGLPVMVEKPFVTDLREGLQLISLAQEKGLVLSVTQSGRGSNHLRILANTLAAGRIGTPGYMTLRMLRNRDYPELPEYQRREDFPLLQAIVIHHVDMLRHCFRAEVEAVWAHSFNPSWSSYESFAAGFHLFRLDNGVQVCYQGSFCSRNPALPQQYWVIEGSEGSLWQESDWGHGPIWLARLDQPVPEDIVGSIPRSDPDRAFLEAFHRAITTGAEPLAPAADNIHTLAAIHAAIESSRRGEWVSPQELLEAAQP